MPWSAVEARDRLPGSRSLRLPGEANLAGLTHPARKSEFQVNGLRYTPSRAHTCFFCGPLNKRNRRRQTVAQHVGPHRGQFASPGHICRPIVGDFHSRGRHMSKHQIDDLAVMLLPLPLRPLIHDRGKGRTEPMGDMVAVIACPVQKIANSILAHGLMLSLIHI